MLFHHLLGTKALTTGDNRSLPCVPVLHRNRRSILFIKSGRECGSLFTVDKPPVSELFQRGKAENENEFVLPFLRCRLRRGMS